ncbi:MAG: hypothetical protein FWB97_05410 [Oscillospiraceae bacterium]|nr:hypothetical protein [Oscillospiraceae bacterium]
MLNMIKAMIVAVASSLLLFVAVTIIGTNGEYEVCAESLNGQAEGCTLATYFPQLVDCVAYNGEEKLHYRHEDPFFLYGDRGWLFCENANQLMIHVEALNTVVPFPLRRHGCLFGLPPLYVEFPLSTPTSSRGSTSGVSLATNYREVDWGRYQHRLSHVRYSLRIHYSLYSEVETVVFRNLVVDGVVGSCFAADFEWRPTRFLNTEVFEKFLLENVDITIITESVPDVFDSYSSTPKWLIFNGGCYHENMRCQSHPLVLWLKESCGIYRTIWDMKMITEPGCGRSWSWSGYWS